MTCTVFNSIIYFIELLKGSQNKMDLAANFSFLYLDLLRTRYHIAGNFRGGGGQNICGFRDKI